MNDDVWLTNIYDPNSFGLSGIIRKILPRSGDGDKMYILDSYEDKGETIIVTLELYNESRKVTKNNENGT